MKKKRILVTGSNGLLGQKLNDLYLGFPDIEYFASSRGENRYPIEDGYHYIPMDVGNEINVREVIRDVQPDAVIHTAALTQVDQCETDRELCDLLNIEALRFLSDSLSPIQSHLIHLSTDFIFDGTDGPYKEDDQPNPLSYYGWSKLKAEEVVKSYKGPWSIARTILVYGVVADMSRSNVVLWALNALREGKAISVVDDQYRMPTLAEDLAAGCRLIEHKQAKGIFHLSGADYMNIFDLVQRVAQVANLNAAMVQRADSKTFRQPARRPPKTGFDLSKAREILGYMPRTFEQGVKLVMRQSGMA